MIKKLLLLIFLLIGFLCSAQKNRKSILGVVKADSLSTENIHIINKNTNIGTLSNQYGEFRIPLKENDTLIFSGIQFKKKFIIITKQHLQDQKILIFLNSSVKELEEVIVKRHNLTGTLNIDANNLEEKNKAPISNEEVLSLHSSDIISDTDKAKSYRPKAKSIKLTDPIPQKVGIDFIALYRFVRLKMKRKNKGLGFRSKKELTIRNYFGDSFFTETLNISPQNIDSFIKHCENIGALELLQNSRTIELIELMIKESNMYVKKK